VDGDGFDPVLVAGPDWLPERIGSERLIARPATIRDRAREGWMVSDNVLCGRRTGGASSMLVLFAWR
jgi:hypothetical protein